jgi:hypothetical protein
MLSSSQSLFLLGVIVRLFQYQDYITSSGKIIGKWWIGNNLEGSGRGLIEVLSRNLHGVIEENNKEFYSGHPVSGPKFRVQVQFLVTSFPDNGDREVLRNVTFRLRGSGYTDLLLGILFDPETLGSLRTVRRYKPKYRILHNHGRVDLKFNI